jgi:NAD(P)-dependent dehydrogenase (short-subunit alcohol dehydrogenase family)
MIVGEDSGLCLTQIHAPAADFAMRAKWIILKAWRANQEIAMSCILVTGANRGLGLEWVRQYALAGWQVHATCRRPEEAAELNALAAEHAQVSVHRLDVCDSEQLHTLQLDLEEARIDVLLNNAGVYLDKFSSEFGSTDYDVWSRTFAVNTTGAMRVSEAFVEQVARSEKKQVVAITSHMGSIAEITTAGNYAYRSSKAALNAAMKGLSWALTERGIGVLLLHPGWVRTRMGGRDAPLTVQQSVTAMRKLVEDFAPEMNGRFLRYNGTEIPW